MPARIVQNEDYYFNQMSAEIYERQFRRQQPDERAKNEF